MKKRPPLVPPSAPENDTAKNAPGGVYFSFDMREALRPGFPLRDPDAPPLTVADDYGEMFVALALRVLDKQSGIAEQRLVDALDRDQR